MAGDVHFVTSWLAVGGAISDEADVRDILGCGVTHVINCRFTDDSRLLCGRTSYLWNPAPDDGEPKAPNWFLRAVRFALCAHQDPDSKILVHCAGGAHRSPALELPCLHREPAGVPHLQHGFDRFPCQPVCHRVMDRLDLTFDTTPIHHDYPNLPTTSLADVLARHPVAHSC